MEPSPRPLAIASIVIFVLLVAAPYFLFVFTTVTVGPDGIPALSSPFRVRIIDEWVQKAAGRNLGAIQVIWAAMFCGYILGLTLGLMALKRAFISQRDKLLAATAPLLYVAIIVFAIAMRP